MIVENKKKKTERKLSEWNFGEEQKMKMNMKIAIATAFNFVICQM